MRYERKYKTEHLALPLVVQTIKLHPASFRKIFPDRQVNNIYLDTADFTTYKENVMGIAQRKKFRIRWYGKDLKKVENPILEIKIKNNQLGDKISHALPSFEIQNIFQNNTFTKKIEDLSKSKLPLQPTLLNSYLRSYYGTPDGKFRVTIDREMRFLPFLNKNKIDTFPIEDKGVVVELKYDEKLDGETDRITQYFPFRMTKSSKYVTGVSLVNG